MSSAARGPGRAGPPTQAGIYDYLLGGHHHTPADRDAAEKALITAPEARVMARQNRAFTQRAVCYMAERGVRQYIDLGSGFPTVGAWDGTRSAARLRMPAEVDGWFVGFDMVGPGLVTTTEWGTMKPAPSGQAVMLAGVGRVP